MATDPASTEEDPEVRAAKQALAILRVHAAQIKELEKFRSDLARRAHAQVEKLSGPEGDDPVWPALGSAARILIDLNPVLQDKALRSLPEEIRQQVIERLYSFEAIPRHPAPAVQALIRSINNRVLATALLGAPSAILEVVTANVSRRAAQILAEDIESVERQEDITARDVREARRDVGDEFYRLYLEGELGGVADE